MIAQHRARGLCQLRARRLRGAERRHVALDGQSAPGELLKAADKTLYEANSADGFPVMSIRDIIASKWAAGRKRDLAELELLESFREVYEASKARRKF